MESYSSQLIKLYTNEEAMAHTNNLKFQFFHCFKIFISLQSYKNHSNSIITTEKHIPTKSKFQSDISRICTKTQTTQATHTKTINSTKCMIASTTIPTALHKRTHISLKKNNGAGRIKTSRRKRAGTAYTSGAATKTRQWRVETRTWTRARGPGGGWCRRRWWTESIAMAEVEWRFPRPKRKLSTATVRVNRRLIYRFSHTLDINKIKIIKNSINLIKSILNING